jgi:hypothetical protein
MFRAAAFRGTTRRMASRWYCDATEAHIEFGPAKNAAEMCGESDAQRISADTRAEAIRAYKVAHASGNFPVARILANYLALTVGDNHYSERHKSVH